MKRINIIVKHTLRKALCDKFGGKCAYCQKHVGMAGTVDHYLPQALGGTNDRANLRWCCTDCNGLKADLHPDVWAERMPEPVVHESKEQKRLALLASIAPCRREKAGAA